MKDLDKSKVYSLEDLTSGELTELIDYLKKKYWNWEEFVKIYDGYTLQFNKEHNTWYQGITKPTANAKELFYTLENIQVDCRKLTQERIEEMAYVFKINKYTIWDDIRALDIENGDFLMVGLDDEVYLNNGFKSRHTITYEKFMELFGYKEKSEEFKNLVDVLNEELTEEYNNSQFKQIANSLADLLEYKNKMYGNSALEPLNIFNNKTKVGQRIDDKLARVKNSTELRKNDIVDILGYLMLVCKENNWTNFDELKD